MYLSRRGDTTTLGSRCVTEVCKHACLLEAVKDGPWGGRVEAGLEATLYQAWKGELNMSGLIMTCQLLKVYRVNVKLPLSRNRPGCAMLKYLRVHWQYYVRY